MLMRWRLTFVLVTSVLTGCDGGSGSVDAGPLLEVDELCTDDAQCADGYCYGHVTPLGTFTDAVCHRSCIAADDDGHFCESDFHCCEGERCCLDCPGQNGTCVPE